MQTFSWHPPPHGKHKLKFDGAVFYLLNISGVGADEGADERGDMIMAMSKPEDGVNEVDEIEALAALRGFQMLISRAISNLILEDNALSIVEAPLVSDSVLSTCYAPLICEIKSLLSNCPILRLLVFRPIMQD